MNAIWLAALVLGSVFAIAGARELRWKLINAVVILGCMGVGFGLGYAPESGKSPRRRPDLLNDPRDRRRHGMHRGEPVTRQPVSRWRVPKTSAKMSLLA